MRNMLKIMKLRAEAGEDLALVTIIASSGATPRGAGARMLVGKTGRICGTIGGGAVEYRCEQLARQVLEENRSLCHDFSLTKDDVESLGMICGGSCQVFFCCLAPEDAIALAEEALGRFGADEPFWLVCDLDTGALQLTQQEGELSPWLGPKPRLVQAGGKNLYLEQLNSPGRVYIFGGGHVAQELVPVLSRVGFRCVVLEDRAEFAKAELFPGAEKVILGDFGNISQYVTIGREDYVCVMTRGHASDTLVQSQVLKCAPCYCGVMGSRRKAAMVRRTLETDYGLSQAELSRVTTPIGLNIGGDTPAEIAISIAAQLIQLRWQKNKTN